MTTIAAFNRLLQDFVSELSDTFDDVAQMTLFKTSLPLIIQANERGGLELFMDAVRPYAEKILKSDRTVFDSPVVIGGLDVSQLWHIEGLDEGSKTAIMNYMNTLFTLGIALENVDAPVLSSIEDMAKQAAAQLEENGSIDLAGMLPDLMKNVGSLLGADMSCMPDASDPRLKNMLDSVMSNFMGPGATLEEFAQIDQGTEDDVESMEE